MHDYQPVSHLRQPPNSYQNYNPPQNHPVEASNNANYHALSPNHPDPQLSN
jgi:hypothetical protein